MGQTPMRYRAVRADVEAVQFSRRHPLPVGVHSLGACYVFVDGGRSFLVEEGDYLVRVVGEPDWHLMARTQFEREYVRGGGVES